jgi:hypothetical protein
VPEPVPVVVNLPPGHEAAYKASLAQTFEFVTADSGSAVTVEPREGIGTTMEYFRATRLCAAGDQLTDATWQPLREHPAHEHEDRKKCRDLVGWADAHLAQNPDDLWSQLRVLRAKVFVLGNQLPGFLAQQAPPLFNTFSDGSLWLITADELLLRRLTFLRAQFAFTLTPDIPVGTPQFDGFRMLMAHSLTHGTDFGQVKAPPLLAFSPGTIGIAMSWAPHVLVLMFGAALDLEKPVQDCPSKLYRPQSFGRPEGWADPPFWQGLTGAEVEPLLPWWVERLNTLYSYAADPTHFHDRFGRHAVSIQTGGEQPGPGQRSLDRRAAEGLEWARWAVRRWSAFPVRQTPRPLVLVESRVRIEKGFKTGEAKMAFLEGRFESSVAVPAAVLDALARQGRPDQRRSGRPLLIIEAELLESEFQTDRGPRRAPAWRLTAEDALGPIWVLDPDVVDWQPAADAGGSPPDLQTPGQDPAARVDVGADQHSMVVHWLGASPAFERYPKAEVVDSAEAFAVVPVGVDIGPPGARTLAGFVHRVPAALRDPVGARVYVNLHGHAGRVVKTGDPGRAR